MLTFGVTVLPDPPYTRLLELMEKADEAGFDNGWTYDSHILWHESYPLLALAADRTEKVKLGHCVTNPGIREPTITASYYATLHEISNGRAVMGIGRGDSSRRVVGLKPVKVAEFEQALRMMKDLMNGRPVVWNEKELQLEWVRDGAADDRDVGRGLRAEGARGRGTRRRRRDHPARRSRDHRLDHGHGPPGRRGGRARPGRAQVPRLRAEPHLGRHRGRARTRCAGSRRWSRTTSWI